MIRHSSRNAAWVVGYQTRKGGDLMAYSNKTLASSIHRVPTGINGSLLRPFTIHLSAERRRDQGKVSADEHKDTLVAPLSLRPNEIFPERGKKKKKGDSYSAYGEHRKRARRCPEQMYNIIHSKCICILLLAKSESQAPKFPSKAPRDPTVRFSLARHGKRRFKMTTLARRLLSWLIFLHDESVHRNIRAKTLLAY
ncbi:hypothetical protein RRF57_002827 [Xylaria bambusicola]|uniref:Uncharacterized protein n=1 Tax=Xylaria bambusicola TaxID=326684 RepID=A0AAN7Z2U1_9PEZI